VKIGGAEGVKQGVKELLACQKSLNTSSTMPPKKDKKVVAANEEPKDEAQTDKKPAKGAKK